MVIKVDSFHVKSEDLKPVGDPVKIPNVFYRHPIRPATKEIYARVKPAVAERLEELLQYYHAPSISQMIEALLEESIEEMDRERRA